MFCLTKRVQRFQKEALALQEVDIASLCFHGDDDAGLSPPGSMCMREHKEGVECCSDKSASDITC